MQPTFGSEPIPLQKKSILHRHFVEFLFFFVFSAGKTLKPRKPTLNPANPEDLKPETCSLRPATWNRKTRTTPKRAHSLVPVPQIKRK